MSENTQNAQTFNRTWIEQYLTGSAEAWAEKDPMFKNEFGYGLKAGYDQCAEDLMDLLTDPDTRNDDAFVLAVVLVAFEWKNHTRAHNGDFERAYENAVRDCGQHLTNLVQENWTR
jgi:hypothetical protein